MRQVFSLQAPVKITMNDLSSVPKGCFQRSVMVLVGAASIRGSKYRRGSKTKYRQNEEGHNSSRQRIERRKEANGEYGLTVYMCGCYSFSFLLSFCTRVFFGLRRLTLMSFP